MKQIYLLRGASNTGKSTTLKQLFLQIIDHYPDALIYFEKISNIDFYAILEKNNVKIGIYSSGDTKWVVFNHLGKLHDWDCNYIIGAVRTFGGTNDAVNSYAELFDKEIEWLEKSDANDIDNINNQEKLFNIIKKIFKLRKNS